MTVRPDDDRLHRQLETALEIADDDRIRYHLREALQLRLVANEPREQGIDR
ncbi:MULTISPECIES: hypothetical protein [Halomicrobium]|uniref:Uncharacterized protein n=1 Tax=Halomicrobium mukohataei (strain ATCC 700874 / DSM 12286 / JCM 9738 / NCIMB 13541) TaxID=485914 RepID=C7P058_HALMD|nr:MULTISPECIES: hypothetical protein [Halomicrobium]ACV48850.1 hypothetical protein Hmuk_2744 [Halomicrobium mukohataei DSM 12286]